MFTRKKIIPYFKDKKICLVGNSIKIFESNYSALIESYDVVCRFNKGISKLGDPYYGSRVDVYFYSHHMSMPAQYRNDPKLFKNAILIQTGRHNRDTVIDKNKTYQIPLSEHSFLKEKFNLTKKQDPTTGVIAFNFLLSCKPKKIILIGFDWKEKPTFYDLNRHYEPHDYAAEKKYILTFPKSVVEVIS